LAVPDGPPAATGCPLRRNAARTIKPPVAVIGARLIACSECIMALLLADVVLRTLDLAHPSRRFSNELIATT
jgi:hypothetical protein